MTRDEMIAHVAAETRDKHAASPLTSTLPFWKSIVTTALDAAQTYNTHKALKELVTAANLKNANITNGNFDLSAIDRYYDALVRAQNVLGYTEKLMERNLDGEVQ